MSLASRIFGEAKMPVAKEDPYKHLRTKPKKPFEAEATGRSAGGGMHILKKAPMEDIELTEAKAKLGSGARFKTLKKKLSKKGAKSSGALDAWIGRKKFGKAKFAKLSTHGKHHTYTEDTELSRLAALVESLAELKKSIVGN